MNTTRLIAPLSIALLIAASSCGNKKSEAAVEREKWLLSLNDSISLYQTQIDSVTRALSEMQGNVGSIIGDFDYVNNPREVEGYYIFKGWKGRYPLTSTGLVARITEGEGFELMATLTGAHFNEIAASADGETVASSVVPHDQALNYRAGNLNTVCFSGGKADSIGEFIATHPNAEITIAYLNGSRTGALRLPKDQKDMISATWNLYSRQRLTRNLEKELPRLSGKVAACRRMLEMADSTLSKE